MASAWQTLSELKNMTHAIARQYNISISTTKEQERVFFSELFSEAFGEGFFDMEDDIEEDIEEDIQEAFECYLETPQRLHSEEYYIFRKLALERSIDHFLSHYEHQIYPKMSYYTKQIVISDIVIKESKTHVSFEIQNETSVYPTKIRMSKKQLFLLTPYLQNSNIHKKYLYDLPKLAAQLKGKKIYILKYLHDYDHEKSRAIYWTYSMFSYDPSLLCQSFLKSVEGNYLPTFHPEVLPKPTFGTLKVDRSRKVYSSHIVMSNRKHLKIYTKKGRRCIGLKDHMLAVVYKNQFAWLTFPMPEIIPEIERLLQQET